MDGSAQDARRTELPHFEVMPFEEAYRGVEKRVIFGRTGFKAALMKSSLRLFRPFMRRNHRFVADAEDCFRHTDIREHGISMHFRRFSFLQFNAMLLLKGSPEPRAPLERAAATLAAALRLHCDFQKRGDAAFGVSGGSSNTRQLANIFGRAFTPQGRCLGIVDASKSKHITVFVNGHAYRMTVIDKQGTIGYAEALSALQEIVRQETSNHGERLGPLTVLKVKDYTKALKSIHKSPEASESIRQIERSLFALCLDLDVRTADKAELFRDLYSRSVENRFHLLATQIIVSGNGDVGVIHSHPIGIDGQIMAIFGDALFKAANAIERESAGSSAVRAFVEALPLKRVPGIEKKVPNIRHKVPFLFEYEDFGRGTFKKAGLSPDSAIHIAMMIAAKRVFGRVPNLVQFVSMRHFQGGRLCRPHVTPRSLAALIDAIEKDGVASTRASRLLLQASAEHMERIVSTRQKGDPYDLCVIPGLDVNRGRPNLLNALFFLIYLKLLGSDRPDIITSHLRMPDSIQLIGKPGAMFNQTNMFGAHIVLEEHRSTLTLMPTRSSLSKIHLLRDEIGKAVEMILSLRGNLPRALGNGAGTQT